MFECKSKSERQRELRRRLKANPFLTDEELAARFCVSVPTIRLDRLSLNIAGYRERISQMAKESLEKLRSMENSEFVGDLVYINPGHEAISLMETEQDMVFEKSRVVRGHFIYAMAESLAIAVIDANAALIGVANIKYKNPVSPGMRLIARASIKTVRGNKYIVWVKIKHDEVEVFQGKFLLAAVGDGAQ